MEINDLIYLVSCAVNEERPDPERVASMDLDALYGLASEHMLAAAAAPALEEAGVKDERFVRAGHNSFYRNLTMDMDMEDLFSKMSAEGIWHMPLKGIVLQHLYPQYGMRQMSDHDILFDASRAENVRSIMEGMGFNTKEFGTGHHDVYFKEPVSFFEMHKALFGRRHDKKLYEYYGDIEKKLLGDGLEKHFSPEDFYIYMIAHEYKHYWGSGTGLRSLLDTYVFLQKNSLDMAYVAGEAEKLGIGEFEVRNRSLAQHLFSGRDLTEDERAMLKYVLDSGVYGTDDHRLENAIPEQGWGKLLYVLKRFFVPVSRKNPDYTAFSLMYPFFYRHKLLLPFLPFYRIFQAVRSGRLIVEAKAVINKKIPSDRAE